MSLSHKIVVSKKKEKEKETLNKVTTKRFDCVCA